MPIPQVLSLSVKGIDTETGIKRTLSMESCQEDNLEKAKLLMQGFINFINLFLDVLIKR